MTRKKLLGPNFEDAAQRVLTGIRAESQMKQTEVSAALGRAKQWTNLLEKGHYTIKLRDFVELCLLYDKYPPEILERILKLKT